MSTILKIIKKVKITNIPKTEGSIVDSMSAANVDKTSNAPSIRAVLEKIQDAVSNILNAKTADRLTNSRNIKITGAVQGEAKFDGSKDITIEVSNIKSVVDYLFYQIYTNNQILVKQVLGVSRHILDIYQMCSDKEGMQLASSYYCMQIDALFMNSIRYLSDLLPSTNIYKNKLNNWIRNVPYIKNNSYEKEADAIAAQQFIVLANNSEGTTSTLQIANNDSSLPYLLLQLKNSLQEVQE